MVRISRLCAVAFVIIGGLVHLELWRSGYKAIPYVGKAFLVNVALAGLVGVAVLIRDDWRVHVAGVVFATGSLAALVLSRTVGFLGFTERAWTDRAVQATTAEIGAIVALAAIMMLTRQRQMTLARVKTSERPALRSRWASTRRRGRNAHRFRPDDEGCAAVSRRAWRSWRSLTSRA